MAVEPAPRTEVTRSAKAAAFGGITTTVRAHFRSRASAMAQSSSAPTAHLVQHLGQLGLHPRALARRQNDRRPRRLILYPLVRILAPF